MAQHGARGRALVLATGLALAIGLAACSGSADDAPAPVATEAAPQLGEPAESPAPEASTPPAPTATPPPSPTSDEPAKPDAPTSTPTATPTPPTEPHDPSASPVEPPPASPSPPAPPAPTPTPTPCLDLECIEPAPGVFEQRIFEDGEEIDWTKGIFVLDPETGRTEGYALVDAELGGYEYQLHSGGWIVARGAVHSRNLNPGNFLLDRETGQSWRWPSDTIWPMATSREHLVFSDWARLPRPSTYHFTITNRALEAVSRFSIPVERSDFYGFFFPVFSPDGRTFVFGAGDSVYLMAVGAAAPTALIQWGAGDGPRSVSFDSQYRRGGPDLYLVARYENESGDPHVERHRFRWEDGLPLDPLEAACEAQPQPFWDSRYAAQRSPDGRYVAQFVGGYVYETHTGVHTREDPWPSVVIAEAATCAPLFRVRSARLSSLLQTSGWLATSDGFVVGTDGVDAIVRIHPTPDLVLLPSPVAEPAPTGDGRYFGGSGSRVYDLLEDRWLGPRLVRSDDPPWPRVYSNWGDSHRERWFAIFPHWFGGSDGWTEWLLLSPTIEFPPFSDVIAFRVAGTGSCLRLRAAPGEDSETTDCLPDGTRLVLTEPRDPPPDLWRPQLHPAVVLTNQTFVPRSTWLHVRTEAGAEGWVSHDYLEHD